MSFHLPRLRFPASLLLASVILPPPALAEERPPRPVIDVAAGWSGFIDEDLMDHAVVGGSVRWYVTERLSVGPEAVYMVGPGDDRDVFVTGNLTFDVVGCRQKARVVPYLAVGGGLMRHSDRFGTISFSSSEVAVTGGGGVRVRVTDRVSVGADFRVGWEPRTRVTGTVSIALP